MTNDELKLRALTAAHDIAPLLGHTVPLNDTHPAVKVIRSYLEDASVKENETCEQIANETGDHREKAGQPEKAEVAWGVAARIRMRRPKQPF